jgi:hypothetical protein
MDVAERHENDGKNLDQRQLTAAKKSFERNYEK